MKKEKIPNLPIKTFYISKETISSPHLIEIIKMGKILIQNKILNKNSDFVMSMKYGKRMIISSEIQDFEKISKDELIEVADYDPIKKNMLIIGPGEHKKNTALHWMLHYAIKDINTIVEIKNNLIDKKITKNLIKIQDNYPKNSVDYIKEALVKIKDNNILLDEDGALFFIGKKPAETLELILKTFEGAK